MNTARRSERIRTKPSENDELSKEEQQKNAIRYLYGQDMHNCQDAFVRLIHDDDVLNISMPGDDDEMRGILVVGALPKRVSKFDWSTVSVFHNEHKICIVDSFNLMNDDKLYRTYIESINESKFEEKEIFLSEYMKVGQDLPSLEHNAHKKGKKEGVFETCQQLTKQVLIYLALKAKKNLTETLVKRAGVQTAYEHLWLFAFKKKGFEILKTMAGHHSVCGTRHDFIDIDWDIFVQYVGIDCIAKKVSDKLFFYADVRKISYNESNHQLSMDYVGIRWNGKKRRHRNIPLLFSNNK